MNNIELLNYMPTSILDLPADKCIELYHDIFSSYITREGSSELASFVEKSDFFTAPASTRFHMCVPNGLLKHSLIVMLCLLHKKKNPVWGEILKQYSEETLIIVSIFHDLCKTYFYKSSTKNVKVYKENGTKHDAGGNYDWETQPCYEVNDKYPLGHGEKSCYFLTKFIDLNIAEYSSIRWHMGYTLPKDDYSTLGNAMDTYPLVLALHEADLEATHLIEVNYQK